MSQVPLGRAARGRKIAGAPQKALGGATRDALRPHTRDGFGGDAPCPLSARAPFVSFPTAHLPQEGQIKKDPRRNLRLLLSIFATIDR
jgi:hypothetical protein